MKKLKAGVIGLGFAGKAHLEAIRRLGFVDVVAICENGKEFARKKADEVYVEKAYYNYDDLINDPDIDVIHNCTPNNEHFIINKKIIEKGKHVFTEKPLALNSQESAELVQLLYKHKVVNGVNFNYRMFPLVQVMKEKVKSGEIGNPYLVHGSFLQDWLLYETDYNWRLDEKVGGKSRAIADIGSHWCDLSQNVLNSKITEVFADLATIIPIRKKSKMAVETFKTADSNSEFEDVPMTTEDYGAVMVKFANGTRGIFYVSQVSAGRKCCLSIEVDGSKTSLAWSQEECEKLWIGSREKPNCYTLKDPALLSDSTKAMASLPAGHSEGWADALKNNISSFYKSILNVQDDAGQCDFATIRDGHNIMLIVDAILESNEKKQWIKVNQI